MNPLETLSAEHRRIEAALDILDRLATALEQDRDVTRDDVALLATFLRVYADAYHHGKEEDLLFTAMVAHGFSRETGPVAMMLHEHDEGRRLVSVLRLAGEGTGPWALRERRRVAGAARMFTQLLRVHIHKEDNILYPMAEAHLPAGVMVRMVEDFERVEAQHGPEAARWLSAVAAAFPCVAGAGLPSSTTAAPCRACGGSEVSSCA
jgi:hemerythrin-like domain-containing protein